MQKILTLFIILIFLFVSSMPIHACDYYEDVRVIFETLETGVYYKKVSGVICSHNDKDFITVKNGILEGLVKLYYSSGELTMETNYKNGNVEGLEKLYYESGVLKRKINYKNNKREGLAVLYLEDGRISAELHYSNDKFISGKCGNGRKWTNKEISYWEEEEGEELDININCN